MRRIVCDAAIIGGKPRIEGTRLWVAYLAGKTREEVEFYYDLPLTDEEWTMIVDWLSSEEGKRQVRRAHR